jgi:hypothetical protein
MNNLTIKDLVDSIGGPKFHCVPPDWTLNRAVSYLIKINKTACPVANNPKKGLVSQIKGYFLLKEISLKLGDHGEDPVKNYMRNAKWELSDSQYLVDQISVIYRKPVFAIKNHQNQFYTTIYPSDVADYLYNVSNPFILLRAIENRLAVSIFTITENKDIFEIPIGEKIEVLFSDEVWNNLGLKFDKNTLHDLLNRCSDQRNLYFHFRDDEIDIKLLKRTWNIIKRELDG